jgi:hypothetical protein
MKVAPYHAITEEESEQRVVRHHDDCPDGRRIKSENRRPGSSARPRCDERIGLG